MCLWINKFIRWYCVDNPCTKSPPTSRKLSKLSSGFTPREISNCSIFISVSGEWNSALKLTHGSFALSLFFSKISRNSIPWTSQYVKGDDMIRYISMENKKRQIGTEESQEDIRTILVHTSIPFYHRMKGKSDEEITHMILERLFLHLPCLQSAETLLESSNLYRWDLSQVVPSSQSLELDNIDGGRLSRKFIFGKDYSFLVTQSGPGESNLPFPFLGIAGDYFTESNFNGCAKSARDLVEKIVSQESRSDRNV
jgi:hypothetical protein